jgi:hypothetical protein
LRAHVDAHGLQHLDRLRRVRLELVGDAHDGLQLAVDADHDGGLAVVLQSGELPVDVPGDGHVDDLHEGTVPDAHRLVVHDAAHALARDGLEVGRRVDLGVVGGVGEALHAVRDNREGQRVLRRLLGAHDEVQELVQGGGREGGDRHEVVHRGLRKKKRREEKRRGEGEERRRVSGSYRNVADTRRRSSSREREVGGSE